MGLTGVHSDLPDNPGEDVVARALLDASAGRWHLWFGLQRGSGREMDCLVIAPDVGCFCIEVKDWKLGSIREYSDDEVVTGSGRHLHPLKQAQIAQHGLMDHLDQRGISKADKPYFYATAAFPRINRGAMYDACSDEWSRHFEGMLFADDLADPDSLTMRLIRIGDDAPLNPTARRYAPRQTQIDAVVDILNRRVVIKHQPIRDDLRRELKRIHDAAGQSATEPSQARQPTAVERRAALQKPGTSLRNGVSRVVFHGKPGTGKTTQLLKIALAHALAGRLTLVCCYTKVLAADLRARVAADPAFDHARDSLLVVDMGQLGLGAEDSVGISGFQTICVDEAQDVSEERFARLEELAAEGAEWFLSDAPGQAIFDERSPFLDDAVAIAKANETWEPLRVNRRSGVAERLVADAALEVSPDVGRIAQWVADHPVKTSALDPDDEQAAFDISVPREVLGHMPEFTRLTSDTSWGSRVAGYHEVLMEEVARQGGDRSRVDLAIVSVRRDAMSDEWKKVRAALSKAGLSYLDQIDNANRRRSPAAGEVRLSTIHSIRGIDARRVVLLDLEGLEAMPEEARSALLNIALSRARDGTRIVLRPMEAVDGSHRAFLERLIAAYSQA